MTTLRSGSATDVGKVRSSNQDVALEDPDLFAVADGMGGHVGGEVAARVAIDTLRAAFQRDASVEGLRRAVAEANRAVWRQGQSESGLRGMGTTLTATALAQVEGGRQVIALANVGDSRAYVFSKGEVIQVTSDHSLAEEKVRQGQLTEAEAAVHPHRHILTRALGVASDVDVDLWELHLREGDRILLCSDGLTNEVGVERIGEVLRRVGDPRDAAKALVDAAVDHGGSDNVTVVVVDVVSADASPRPGRATGEEAAAAGGASATVAGTGADAGSEAPDSAASTTNGSSKTASRAKETSGGGGARTHGLRAIGGGGSGALTAAGDDKGAQTARPLAVGTRERPDGEVPSTGGPITGARLQAAELRRWQPTRDDRRTARHAASAPRLITFRSVLFVILLLAVVGAAYALVRWYAMDEWYVGTDHGHLAVYQGRPGGFLWFKPQLVDVTPVTTSGVPSYVTVRHDRIEPTQAAATSYIHNLHEEYLSSKHLATGGSASSTQPATGTTTTTTGAATG